jgi:hypothetical protein
VVAEVGGKLAAPVYGMMQVQDLLKENGYVAPDGVAIDPHWLGAPNNDSTTAIEWAGEWTVTYETFRDMGAAFAVALVLIYVLVVWEFGNFRIPALIMAPIPLTLLGIIPAHFVFFQMGWGGEFTATSMIGWIALAGIIVRNSILLVDFSIHQIQQGTEVIEAVIMACKTRTRPIMITAFALVCGSSVIFFDPIFQGMAISLASGVLVSTVLTLIVIPLGCIAASKDLLEVAAATAPDQSLLPQGQPTSPQASEPAVAPTPAATTSSGRPSIPARVWGAVVGLVTMIFYLFRGLFLLLFQRLGRADGRKKKQSTNAPSPVASGGGGEGSSGTPPASTGPGSGQNEVPSSMAAKSSEVSSTTAVAEENQNHAAAASSSQQPEAEVLSEQESDDEVVEESEAPVAAKQIEKPAQQPPPVTKRAAPKTKKRPSTLKKQAKKKTAKSQDQALGSGSTTTKAKPSNGNGNGSEEKEAGRDEVTEKREAVSNVAPFPVRKKSPRRGIRLK